MNNVKKFFASIVNVVQTMMYIKYCNEKIFLCYLAKVQNAKWIGFKQLFHLTKYFSFNI